MERKIQELNEKLQSSQDRSERNRLQKKLQELQDSLLHQNEQKSQRQQIGINTIIEALEKIPIVEIDEGANKFVLVRVKVKEHPREWYFVRAKTYAKYHYMAAEPLIDELQRIACLLKEEIEVLGGGRISFLDDEILAFGYSNQFGQAPMEKVVEVIKKDPKYQHCSVDFSLEGY